MAIWNLEFQTSLKDTWRILELLVFFCFFKLVFIATPEKSRRNLTYFRAIIIVFIIPKWKLLCVSFNNFEAHSPRIIQWPTVVRHLRKKSRGTGATRTRNFIIVYRSHIQTLTNLDQLVKISATKIRYSGGNMCKPLELPSIHELHNINLCNYESVPMQLLAQFRHVCQHSWICDWTHVLCVKTYVFRRPLELEIATGIDNWRKGV